MKIFVSATNVETGRAKIFERHALTADMVMASACLPYIFQAVEIDGVPYWDGGYMGNTALFPFFNASGSNDVIAVGSDAGRVGKEVVITVRSWWWADQ